MARSGQEARTGRTLRQPKRTDGRSTRYADPSRLIDERPAEATNRVVTGHWQGDLITGTYNATAIATLVDQTSGYVELVHLPLDHTT